MLAEFVYCYLLRPWPLRQLTNWTIRKLLPKQLQIGEATIVLNPNDPVVSGALNFGVYEKAETKFFQTACHSGMTFLDVGANIGYYTALATRAVGPNGKVIALEPDPESFQYLEQTIGANAVGNVLAFPIAASDVPATLPLFISHDNRGDNRLYRPGADWPKIEVEARPIDALLAENDIETLDLIKIDVQGYEPKVIAGLRDTIAGDDHRLFRLGQDIGGAIDASGVGGGGMVNFAGALEGRIGLLFHDVERQRQENRTLGGLVGDLAGAADGQRYLVRMFDLHAPFDHRRRHRR